MPKFISECGDVLLFAFVGLLGRGPLVLLFQMQVSLIGVLKGLSGAFMSSQMIFFSVVLRAGTMGVGSQVMVLSSYLLRFVHNHL